VDPEAPKTRRIARLDAGQAFGEMALLDGGTRTATARANADSELLVINRADFEYLIKFDPQLARAERLSHSRALTNLSLGGPQAQTWVKFATAGLDRLSRYEADRLLEETGSGARAGDRLRQHSRHPGLLGDRSQVRQPRNRLVELGPWDVYRPNT